MITPQKTPPCAAKPICTSRLASPIEPISRQMAGNTTRAMRQAMEEIDRLDVVRAKSMVIRVEMEE